MNAYPLRHIPDDLWHRVKVKALADHVTVREVILTALRLYAAGGLEPVAESEPEPEIRGRRKAVAVR